MKLRNEDMKLWKRHAINCTPQEAVAVVYGGRLHPVRNIAKDPENDFKVDPKEILQITGNEGSIEALLHTHPPKHPKHPSKADMQCQQRAAIPFGLSFCTDEDCTDPLWFGDQAPIAPILGRRFVYALWDCFSMVRDLHRINGVTFPDVPREDRWWDEPGKDYYMDHLESAGFEIIDRQDVRPGACFLMSFRSKTGVNNHAGMYLGGDLMAHHLLHALSKREPMGRWLEKVSVWVRHKDLQEGPVNVT